MILTIGLILIALWFIGFIVFPVAGFFIHILLVVAVIVILAKVIKSK